MSLMDILSTKGRHVHTIGPKKSLQDVVNMLVANNCGSLVVMDNERMVGIITERDILRACSQGCELLAKIPVEARMTRDVVTCTPECDVETVMGMMTHHRVRHMPVLEEGRLVGLVSIGDIVKEQHDRLSVENHFLRTYIQS